MWWFLLRNVNIPIMSAVQSTGPPLRAAGGNKDGILFIHIVISEQISAQLSHMILPTMYGVGRHRRNILNAYGVH